MAWINEGAKPLGEEKSTKNRCPCSSRHPPSKTIELSSGFMPCLPYHKEMAKPNKNSPAASKMCPILRILRGSAKSEVGQLEGVSALESAFFCGLDSAAFVVGVVLIKKYDAFVDEPRQEFLALRQGQQRPCIIAHYIR